MYVFRFENLVVYKEAKGLFFELNDLTKRLPGNSYFIKDQLLRASLSIILNIAEGSGKSSKKEFRRYIQNALGSINEVSACLDILSTMFPDLRDDILLIKPQAINLTKKLGALSNYLKAKS